MKLHNCDNYVVSKCFRESNKGAISQAHSPTEFEKAGSSLGIRVSRTINIELSRCVAKFRGFACSQIDLECTSNHCDGVKK